MKLDFWTTLLARENNIPAINSIRGADLHKHMFSPQYHGQITWTLDNSAWTTFVSRDLMNRARSAGSRGASKILGILELDRPA